MKAKVGDWLVMKGGAAGHGDQRGLITEVNSAEGAPPYVVRWLDDDHEAMVFPGPDAVVITPEEQRAADDGADSRLRAVQRAIRDRIAAGD